MREASSSTAMKVNHGGAVPGDVAIIGIGARFPGGAHSPHAFWSLLKEGRDATREIPGDRWDVDRFYASEQELGPGTMYVRRGGFLETGIFDLDAGYFGISPREALVMDPQQRLLLEVTAEALQDAGIPERCLAGSNTGVFVGAFCMDAQVEAFNAYSRHKVDTHSSMGSTMVMLSNRISYLFDLRGPSLSVDTACSSSLVATHLAVESLARGECDLALVAGVNLIFRPENYFAMCKSHLLSPSGRCMTWDERADGYARGEGAGVVVLERASGAPRRGRRSYAWIRASGVNHDGRTTGIALPNPEAQQRLIQSVLDKAQLGPDDVDYVEAHGTGTRAGDQAETRALSAVFGARPEPLSIGSVKTNIAHLEAAAGIAGLIKTALCLKHRALVPNLHFERPNPNIEFERLGLAVSTRYRPLDARERPLIAGVNSFGYGGTNAHVVLSEVPADARSHEPAASDATPPALGRFMLPLSAQSRSAVGPLASGYAEALAALEPAGWDSFVRHVALRRDHHSHRALLGASTRPALLERLREIAAAPETLALRFTSGRKPLVFVYSGMGPQSWAMGRQLLESEPVFRDAVREVDAHFAALAGWSLLDEFRVPEAESRMQRTCVAQPANFALQVGLTRLLASLGLEPDAVLGHSVGEVTSAYVSGALSLADATRVSYHRSRLQQTTAGTGGMLAVGLPAPEVQERLRGYPGLTISAVNAPAATTVAGSHAELAELARSLTATNVFNKPLRVEVPYHSALMDPIEHELRAALQGITPREPRLSCYSTVTGRRLDGSAFGPDYWWRNVRESVLFADAVRSLLADAPHDFLEVGPHPVLSGSISELLEQAGSEAAVVPTLHRQKPERAALAEALGALYAAGHELDFERLLPGVDGLDVEVPLYPWQKSTYHNDSTRSQLDKHGGGEHPLLDEDQQCPSPTWESRLLAQRFPYLRDHRIGGRTVVPAALYVEAALAAGRRSSGATSLLDVRFERLLALPEEPGSVRRLRVETRALMGSESGAGGEVSVFSAEQVDRPEWTLHARARLATLSGIAAREPAAWDVSGFESRDVQAFYAGVLARGIDYGPTFRPITELRVDGERVWARVSDTLAGAGRHVVPPPLLDAVFQTLFAFPGDASVPFVPVAIERVSVFGPLPERCCVQGRLVESGARTIRANFEVLSEGGERLLEVYGVTCQALELGVASDRSSAVDLYRLDWVREDVLHAASERAIVLVALGQGLASEVQKAFARAGVVHELDDLPALAEQGQPFTVVYVADAEAATADTACQHAARHCAQLVRLAAMLDSAGLAAPPELLVCTRNAQSVVPGDALDGALLAAVWGVVRSINSELSTLSASAIDVGSEPGELDTLARLASTGIAAKPVELGVRGRGIYAQVARRCSVARDATQSRPLGALEGFELVWDRGPGAPARLRPYALEALQSADVEIELASSTWSSQGSQALLPREVVGVVSRTGGQVDGLQPGDSVLAFVHGPLQSHVRLPAASVHPWSSELARSLPDVREQLRVRDCCERLAPLPEGSAVMVKGRPGTFVDGLLDELGRRGHPLYFVDESARGSADSERSDSQRSDTAQPDIARPHVRRVAAESAYWEAGQHLALGAPAAFVNAGSEPFVPPRGSSDEVIVVDYFEYRTASASAEPAASSSGLGPRACSWHRVGFVRRLADARWRRAALCRLSADSLAARGSLEPVPPCHLPSVSLADLSRGAGPGDAERCRIAFDVAGSSVEAPERPLSCDPEAHYVITGGTQGFGLVCAHWLVTRGARHVHLLGRRGVVPASESARLEAMRALGADVSVRALDVAVTPDVQAFFAELDASGGRVAGVIHAAMVLDDDALTRLGEERFTTVFAPKIGGALALGSCLDGARLDFLLLLSSISSIVGNPGQGNYVAANAFLDSYAAALRAQGIPATTINWGVLGEAGVVARDRQLAALLESGGIAAYDNATALAHLEIGLREGWSRFGAFQVDWTVLGGPGAQRLRSSLFREVRVEARASTRSPALERTLAALSEVSEAERLAFIQGQFQQRFAALLRMPADALEPEQSLVKLGLDSLMALESSRALERELGVQVPAMELLGGASIATLAASSYRQLSEQLAAALERTEEALLALDGQSEAELDALLADLQATSSQAAQ